MILLYKMQTFSLLFLETRKENIFHEEKILESIDKDSVN